MSRAKKFCNIHLDKIESSELILLDCDHSFCKSCFFSYITGKLSSKDTDFVCPCESCFKKITYYQVKGAIKKSKFDEIYENLLIESFRSDESEKVVTCLNCKIVYKVWNEAGQFTCNQCGKKYCAQCYGNWKEHAKLTCEQLIDFKRTDEDRLLESYIREKKFMKCPECGITVEKTKYCNIIYCSSQLCEKKTVFCYLCGEKLTPKHAAAHFIDNNTYSYQCVKTIDRNPIDKLKESFIEMRKEEDRAIRSDLKDEKEENRNGLPSDLKDEKEENRNIGDENIQRNINLEEERDQINKNKNVEKADIEKSENEYEAFVNKNDFNRIEKEKVKDQKLMLKNHENYCCNLI